MFEHSTRLGEAAWSITRPFPGANSILNRKNTVLTVGYLSNSQRLVDGLVEGFSTQATNWGSLASMMAGGIAYRIGRVGVMGLGSGNALRAASIGLGLGAEISTFEVVHRGISSVSLGASLHVQNPNLWRWNGNGGLAQGLLQSFVTFGALKGAGHLTRAENIILQHLAQDTAMVAGHQLSGALNIAPPPSGSLAEQFLHAEATNLHIGAGLALAHRLAAGIHALERVLDLSLQSHSAGTRSPRPQLLSGSGEENSPLQAGRQPAFAAVGKNSSLLIPSPLRMEKKKDDEGPPSERPHSTVPPRASGFVRRPYEEDLDALDAGWDKPAEADRPAESERPSPKIELRESVLPEEEVTPIRFHRPGDVTTAETLPPPPESASAGPSSSEPTRLIGYVQETFRNFLLEPKDTMNAIDEAIRDYLTFCESSEEGKKELHRGLIELRERTKIFRERKEKFQYIYTYTKLIEKLGPGDPQYWSELEAVGKLIKDPLLSLRARKVFTELFVDLAENLWHERRAVAAEMKETYGLLRQIYASDDVSPEVRGRAMSIYAEFRSFIAE